ncbi:MAG TPA: hypothetical protein VGO09_05885 [Flavisolibacter sp.]|nr:hypothetical protein [Flavisolibacter sp.]
MRKLLLLIICIVTGTQFCLAQKEKTKEKTKGSNPSFAYTASYSSQFALGSQDYSSVVLNAWKGYDNNTWDVMADNISDTVTAMLFDGTVIKGKDNFLNGIKGYRGSFSAVNSTVEAWLPVKSLDRDQQWVCIWGTETDTKADGSTQKIALHELWRFNKDGKVDYLRQFTQQLPK